jgi:DNA polymerase V
LDELLIEHPNTTFIGIVQGGSMQDVGIFDDDIIIDRHETARNGNVIVANCNGEFVCKIIDTKQCALLSSNQQFQPVTIHEEDDFSIEGEVCHSIRYHRQSPLLCES